MSFILTESNIGASGSHTLYRNPLRIVRADSVEEVLPALDAIDQALDKGLYAAGFFAYEASYALEPRLGDLMPPNGSTPLLWFGVFEAATALSETETKQFLERKINGTHQLSQVQPQWSEADYRIRFEQVKELIAAGDIYQLNLTFPATFKLKGCPLSLYRELRERQKVPHGALIHAPEFSVLSASPEMFFSVRDGTIETRPMKGTAPRGPTLDEDLKIVNWLREDEKSQAENLMIVDLMRNDMSRIAEAGSVAVSDLYSIETHPTLHQMTSGIHARLREDLTFAQVIASIFPSGSITGAPKIRAMEIIAELEEAPRGVYTGAIGAVSPRGDMHFNVAIRSLVISPDGEGCIGIGSGLVADSDPAREYEECLLKMRFLTAPYDAFQLIETILLDRNASEKNDGFSLLDEHLDRLEKSARYFQFPCDRSRVIEALKEEADQHADQHLRMRVLLDREGHVQVNGTPIGAPDPNKIMRFSISPERVESGDVFLYHKTTRRALYDAEFKRATATLGLDEMVFLNEQGQITEGCITNLFIEKSDMLYTPRLSCGLLPGTLRAKLIDSGRAIEAVLYENDLKDAEAIYLGNSVRGLLKAEFLESASDIPSLATEN